MANLFDETRIKEFDVPLRTKEDVLRIGEEFAEMSGVDPDEVLCAAYPPDGVKVSLSKGNRKLILYFFGDNRVVFGKRNAHGRAGENEGELSLDPMARAEREELYHWLRGLNTSG